MLAAVLPTGSCEWALLSSQVWCGSPSAVHKMILQKEWAKVSNRNHSNEEERSVVSWSNSLVRSAVLSDENVPWGSARETLGPALFCANLSWRPATMHWFPAGSSLLSFSPNCHFAKFINHFCAKEDSKEPQHSTSLRSLKMIWGYLTPKELRPSTVYCSTNSRSSRHDVLFCCMGSWEVFLQTAMLPRLQTLFYNYPTSLFFSSDGRSWPLFPPILAFSDYETGKLHT